MDRLNKSEASGRPRYASKGRGRKARAPWDEIDRLLVLGERLTDPETGRLVTRFPSTREIGERYGLAKSTVADFCSRHRCMNRRGEARVASTRKMEKDVTEYRKTQDKERVQLSLDEEIAIIDRYLLAFSTALQEGKVLADNPADFNIMIRLKRFLEGGADARSEVRVLLTLEELRERHRRDIVDTQIRTVEESGETQEDEPPEEAAKGPWGPKALPPGPVIEAEATETDPEPTADPQD